MRSVLERGSGEKEQKRNILILGTSLIVLMLFSTAGYAFFSSDRDEDSSGKGEIVNYRGIEFEKTGQEPWIFEISGYKFETKFNPEQTQNISILTAKTLQDYANKVLYFGVNSNNDISQAGNQEILKNLNQFILRSNYACLNESCEEDYPVKNCLDSEVIIFRGEAGAPKINEDESGCVYIYASNSEAERAADAFLFNIFGI